MNNDITTYRQDPSVSYKDEEKNQVLSVIEDYNTALNLLDYYDHQYMKRPEGHKATYVITYEECRSIIDMMNFKKESELFGNEKVHIPADTRSAFPVISVHSPVSIQCRWQS